MDFSFEENATVSSCQCERSHTKICVIFFVLLTVIVICGGLVYWHYQKGGTANLSSTEQVTGPEKCIYHTNPEFLKRLEADPLGDICRSGTNDFENCNKPGTSSQNCRFCDESTRLPEICFCDKIIHCNGTDSYDDPAKTKSEDCLTFFQKSQYKERGNCNSSLECNCEGGFTNFMCSSIKQRLCKYSYNKTSDRLKDCRESNNNPCVLKQSESELFCEIFTKANRELRNVQLSDCEKTI